MLFKQNDLKRILSGEITLAFRKWKRPTIRIGSLVSTSVGRLEIVELSKIKFEDIKIPDARKAGYAKLEELHKSLERFEGGDLYKIAVRYHSVDPRINLRENDNLSDDDYEKIKERLNRLDQFSKSGKWTLATLETIEANPKLKASELAHILNVEKGWLKGNVRKLKNLGLTISHETGYSISPRGDAYIKKYQEECPNK